MEKLTREQVLTLADGAHLQLFLDKGKGGFATMAGIFVLCNGDEAIVVGKVLVPGPAGDSLAIPKRVLRFPEMGNLRLAFTAGEIAECFRLKKSKEQEYAEEKINEF